MLEKVSTTGHVVPKTEDFKVGQTATYSQVIDDKLVRGYADLTGDHNPIHVDDAFAKRTKFHQRIAHGGILFGMVSMVLGDHMPGIGTIYMSQLVNFHAPVFINDKVTVVVTITALLPKHVAKLSTIVTKQDGTVVMDGVSTIKLPGSLMLQVTPAPAKAALRREAAAFLKKGGRFQLRSQTATHCLP